MKKFIDLTGQRFGRWIVIARAEDYILPSGKTLIQWLCECTNEGNRDIVLGCNLKNGMSKSCGCLHKERNTESRFDDLTGEIFGYLQVIERTNDYFRRNGKPSTQWLCECLNCGNKIIVMSVNLKSGGTISCGCLKESLIATEILCK